MLMYRLKCHKLSRRTDGCFQRLAPQHAQWTGPCLEALAGLPWSPARLDRRYWTFGLDTCNLPVIPLLVLAFRELGSRLVNLLVFGSRLLWFSSFIDLLLASRIVCYPSFHSLHSSLAILGYTTTD